MHPPIVLDQRGDMSIFRSVEDAARYLEPVDVRNGEYIAYDSAGFLLSLVPTGPVVGIPGHLSDQPHPEQLARALHAFLARAWIPRPLEATSLEELLAFCVRRFGCTK